MEVPTFDLNDPGDDIARQLRRLMRAALKHPVAMQSALAALAAEGMRFAETAEGHALRDTLRRSELLKQASRAWEASTLLMFDVESADLPSGYIDALMMAASRPDLAAILDEVMPAGGETSR